MKNDQIEIRICDNGIGLPDDFTISGNDSLGMESIMMFVKQLDADFKIRKSHQTEFIVRFKGSQW